MSDDTDEDNDVDSQQISQGSSSEEEEDIEEDSTWESESRDSQSADSEDRDRESVSGSRRKSVNLPQPSANSSRKRTRSNSDSRGSAKKAYHSDKKLSNDTLLIKQLYKILRSEAVEPPPDLAECNECSAVFDNPADLKAHARSHVKTVRFNPNTSNKFYQCFKCGIFINYRYLNIYKRHMFQNHGIAKPSMDLVSYDPHCRFCTSIIYASRNLTTHIKTKHTNIFLHKPKQCGRQKHSYKYKCIKCNKQFSDYSLARSHRYNQHPECKNLNIIKKITYITKAVPAKINKIKSVPEKNTNVSTSPSGLVPKNALFKCYQCDLHFTNYAAAIQHSASSSHKNQSGWKCQRCQLNFEVTEKKHHLRQHHVTDKFNVYTAVLTMRNRMFCKCPRCKFYLHEQDFRSHYENKCEKSHGSDCSHCKAPIQQASLKFHNQLHTVEGYSGDEMVWIEYVKVPVEKPGVPNEPTISGIYKKTNPAGFKLTISYCQNCKCCMMRTKWLQAHLAGNCASELVKKRRKICITCGLKFTCHQKCPMRFTGIKLDDMKFVRLQDRKIIKPPIPKYYKCEDCGINVCQQLEMDLHDCEGVKKTCKYCQEQFSNKAYKPHVALHEYRKAKKSSGNKISEFLKTLKKNLKFLKRYPSETDKKKILSKKKDTSEDDSSEIYNRNKEQPENQNNIKKQARSIPNQKKKGNRERKNQMQCSSKEWNTRFELFKCDDGLYFTTKEAAEAHASKSSASNKISSDNCSQCGRLFDTSELVKHLCKHHSNYKKVSYDVFKVSSIANDEDSETDESDSDWESEQDDEMKKIGSIAYKCNCCSMHFMSESAVKLHLKRLALGADSLPCKTCDVCGLDFAPRSLGIHKNIHHDILKLSRRDIVIRQRGKRFVHSENLKGTAQNIVKNAEMKSSRETKKLDLYKCTECQLHFLTFKTLVWHISYTDHSASRNMVYCEFCGLGFTKKSLALHKIIHLKNKDLALEDFTIYEYSESSSGDTEEVARPFRDKYTLDSEEVDESTKGAQPSDVLDNYNNNLYKCDTCFIHFIDEGSLRNHKQRMRHRELRHKCSVCDLSFSLNDIPTHIEIHHQKMKLNAKDFNIVSELNDSIVGTAENIGDSTVPPLRTLEANEEISNREKSIKLYKCADCDVHFIAQNSCYKHVLNHRRMDPKEYIECKICRLQFKIVTLKYHMNRHHKTDSFKIEDVLIEEYHPDDLNNGSPKLNIYQASNKAQSGLDSTKTDKDVDVAEASQSDPNNGTE